MFYQSSILLNTDWLAVSLVLEGEEVKPPPPFIWVEYDGTNVWNRRRILYLEDGRKVATLLDKPKSKILNPNAALLEVANEWLYHGSGGWRTIQRIGRWVDFKVVGLSRLDLCFDFVPTASQVDVLEGLASGRYYVAGKRNGSMFWSNCNNDTWVPDMWRGKRIAHCMSYGHKTSDVKWKVYFKSRELREAGNGWFDKPYIVDRWRDVGFDVNNVWRVEVSISGGNGFLFNGEPLTLDAWHKYTRDLAISLYDSRFVVRKKEGHIDKRNDTAVDFLVMRDVVATFKTKRSDTELTRDPHVTLLRKIVESLALPEFSLNKSVADGLIDTCREMVRSGHLYRYFEAMTGMGFEEWADSVRHCAGGDVYGVGYQQDAGCGIAPNTAFE